MADAEFTEEHYLSPGGAEITLCRPVLDDAERKRREELTRRCMCEVYEAWWKSGILKQDADKA